MTGEVSWSDNGTQAHTDNEGKLQYDLCTIFIGVMSNCSFIRIIFIRYFHRKRAMIPRPKQDIRTQAEVGDSEHGLLCLGCMQ